MSLYVYARFSIGDVEPPKACMNILKDLYIGWNLDPVIKTVDQGVNTKVFSKDSFIDAISHYEKEAKGDLAEYSRLKGIEMSKDYYTLPDEGKEALSEDISFMEDSFMEHARKTYVCQHMVDTMNMLEDMFGEGKEKCLVEIFTE